MTTTTSRRHNARNTPALARIKRFFNPRCYALALEAWNSGGEAAARVFMGTMYNDEAREAGLAELFDAAE